MKNTLPTLEKGDKIQLVAPAGRVFPQDLAYALEWAKKNEWELLYDEALFHDFDFGYHYAGTDAHRAAQMQKALDHPEIKAIWCARGGYGSVKIIDQLDFTQFQQNPKWLIGYSDITVFHNKLQQLGYPSLHAVTAKKLNTLYTDESYGSLADCLKGKFPSYKIAPHSFNQNGVASGKLWGGNLSIIYSQLGSETTLQQNNTLLFIEDWCENWYHVDRMMMALKRSGMFEKITGVVVGSFTQMDLKEENPNFEHVYDPKTYEVLHSYLHSLNIPIAYGFPAGHSGDNRALLMGQTATLEVANEQVVLRF